MGLRLSKSGKRTFLGPKGERRRIGRFHILMRDALRADGLHARIEDATSGVLRGLPVLTIFGEKNDPFGFHKRHHATFGDHEGLIITNGNHFPMVDDPDLFADTVREWSQSKNPQAEHRRPLGGPSSTALNDPFERVRWDGKERAMTRNENTF